MTHKLLIMSVIFLIILAAPVFSIGITPSRIKTDFEANEKASFEFTVSNTKNTQINIQIYKKGDLKEYISLSETEITLGPGKSKKLSFTIDYPSEITPGKHDIRIGALEIAGGGAEDGTAVGAVGAVELQFWVYAKYEGKYLDVSLGVPDVAAGEKIGFTVSLASKGTEDIEEANAEIKVYDTAGEHIKTLNTGSTSVSADSTEELYAEWDPGKLPAGAYQAEALVSYDGETAQAETTFNIGELFIKIENIFVDNIPAGSIGKAKIEINSFWNEKIESAYATIDLMSNGKSIKSFKSTVFDIPAQGSKTAEVFIDSEGLAERQYTLSVKVYYSNKVAEKTGTLTVVSPSALPNITLLASVVILILIIIIIIIIYLWNKRKSSEVRRPKKIQPKQEYAFYEEQEDEL